MQYENIWVFHGTQGQGGGRIHEQLDLIIQILLVVSACFLFIYIYSSLFL